MNYGNKHNKSFISVGKGVQMFTLRFIVGATFGIVSYLVIASDRKDNT